MSNMKKVLATLLITVMLLLTVAPFGAAAEEISVDVPISISVENATGIDINIRLNSNYVTSAHIVDTADCISNAVCVDNMDGAKLKVAIASIEPINCDGVLFTVRLTLKKQFSKTTELYKIMQVKVNEQITYQADNAILIDGVVDGATYKKPITISFNEGTAMLNGTAFTSGSTVSESGDYTLVVIDLNGRSRIISFAISSKATVSGTITSFGSETDTIKVELIPDGMTETVYETKAKGNNASYAIPNVDFGVYTLRVTKANHLASETSITVDSEAITQDVALVLGNNGKQFKINSAYLVLSQNINVIYRTTLPEGFENPRMVFTFNGEDTVVTTYNIDEQGRYCYAFTGVNPQKIGDNICATLYATVDGIEVSVSIPTYSVRQYCLNQLSKTTDEAFISLISDLLVYGEKAQIYQNYKADELVTEGLDLTPSTFVALDSSYNKQQIIGTADPNVRYSSANLLLSNEISVQLGVTTDDPSPYTFEVTINDRTDIYTSEDLEYRDGKYYLTFRGIKPSAFDDEITAIIKKDGVQISQTLKYSVHTYIQKNQNTQTDILRELLKAIYNYGESARNYANTQY